jgi:hypothetical protein
MKYAILALAALLNAGCTELVSLNPFVTEQEAVADQSLAGVWTSDDHTIAIRLDGSKYTVTYFEKGPHALKFDGRLIVVGDVKLMDVVEDQDDPFVQPVHMLVRLWPDGHSLKWTFVDSDWMKEQVALRVSVHSQDKRRVITASGDEWRQAIRKLAVDDKASKDGETLTRVQ